MEKQFKARISHKIDIEENWDKATNFIPLKGEIIIYDIDANNENKRIKIGDGVKNVTELDFFSQNANISVDTEVIEDSDNAVSSGAVYTALENHIAKEALSVNGYKFRIATQAPTSEEVDDYTFTFVI